MLEVLDDIDRWFGENETVGLATVIQTWGSAPRKAGAKMAMTPDGKISGSVSGGCVEGAVFEEAVATIEAGQGKLLQYGVADETAWEVGLACGGSISVFVEPLDRPLYDSLRAEIAADRLAALATVTAAADSTLIGRKFVINKAGLLAGWDDPAAREAAAAVMHDGQTQAVTLDENTTLFVEVYLPAPQLIMIGGVHIAVALAHVAKILGYQTIVIDPRRAFGSDERFPHADRLMTLWPEKAFKEVTVNENTAVALLTHDPKIDDPAIKQVLRSDAFYIGALGSRKTHAKRVKRLQEAGFTDEEIGRIHGPIGLNINAQNPEEIAVAVMGQIIKARRT
ncbi:MAG: XdhC family protein [Ardenticatenaceae bacterium]|nr:XdhC family protein [Ardenticatenaceae bacterium]